MLNTEEFLRLQKLAAISLDDQETMKLGTQLGSIVEFLGKLKEIDLNSSDDNVSHSLEVVSGTNQYTDTKSLFANTIHEKIGDSIVINSVVDN